MKVLHFLINLRYICTKFGFNLQLFINFYDEFI